MSINPAQILAYLPDMILIFLSAIACLYCYLLNRRLTKLNNLDTGLGATIVTLTKAIEQTYSAAQSAQTSTLEAVQTLNGLIEKSEKLTPDVEHLMQNLERHCERAKDQQDLLEYSIEVSLDRAVSKAETTAVELLRIVSEIKSKEFYKTAENPDSTSSEKTTSNVRPLKKTSGS
ncbi:MAG: hypothetical protein ACSHXY_02260 [Alphaproteobacteria bacterium]